MSNFYQILGLNRDATTQEIKRAYRKLARTHHPDLGGDEEEFERVTRAYKVLVDVTSRAYYDAKGEPPPEARDINKNEELYNAIQNLLGHAISNMKDPEKEDMIGMMRSAVKQDIKSCSEQIVENMGLTAKAYKVQKRIKSKGAENVMGALLATMIAALEKNGEDGKIHIKLLAECDKFLENYEYEFERVLMLGGLRGAPNTFGSGVHYGR